MHALIVSYTFSVIFLAIGVLNAIYVHLVPGVVYLLLALVYLPQTNAFLKAKLGFSIPLVVKIIFGLIVLWGTLAVGDLAEIYGL